DPAARSAGAAAAAQAWAFNDVEVAARWALGLPSGDVRDAALQPILNRGVTDGSIDTRIVGAFSSAASREQALLAALPTLSGLARRDPDAARTLVRAHYTTPELQQSAQAI